MKKKYPKKYRVTFEFTDVHSGGVSALHKINPFLYPNKIIKPPTKQEIVNCITVYGFMENVIIREFREI